VNLKQRLVLLLSDPEISDGEFRSVKAWLERGGITKSLRDAEGIRMALRSYKDRTAGISRRPVAPNEDTFVGEVDRLLRIETGMTARAALEELAERSGFHGNLPERISFVQGIRRIGKEVGESKVLSAAHQIRNEGVHHTEGPAWPLRS
jgi:hypothetical protein